MPSEISISFLSSLALKPERACHQGAYSSLGEVVEFLMHRTALMRLHNAHYLLKAAKCHRRPLSTNLYLLTYWVFNWELTTYLSLEVVSC